MSTYHQCDFCGHATTVAAELAKVVLPLGAVPDVLENVGAGATRNLDSCKTCMPRIAEALSAMLAAGFDALIQGDDKRPAV